MDDIYADWADKLQDVSLGAIGHAVEMASDEKVPPNRAEFVAHCRTYNPNPEVRRLDFEISPEQRAENRKRISEIAKNLAARASA